MARILRTTTAFPEHYYPQEMITAELRSIWGDDAPSPDVVERLHRATTVEGRYVSAPRDEYYTLDGWEGPSAIYQDQALDLSERLAETVLEEVGMAPPDITQLVYVSTTGISVPSIDARLMNRLPFRKDLKRLPLYGLGCAGGAAGVARLADYLEGHPAEAGLLIAVELCSLTIQKDDTSIPNVIACGLFGDGAAAVLMLGDEHPLADGPRVVASRSVFFPESEHYMGWRVREDGLELLLSADVPAAAGSLRPHIEEFLAAHELTPDDVARWICHPGGPRVIDAIEEAMGLNGQTLAASRAALRRIGNVSSASVLVLLDEVLRSDVPSPGEYGLLTAMGPGFAAELVLLRW